MPSSAWPGMGEIPEADRDKALDGDVVVGRERDPGAEASRRGDPEQVVAAALTAGDPGLLGQLDDRCSRRRCARPGDCRRQSGYGELLGEPSAELRANLAGSPVRLFTPYRPMKPPPPGGGEPAPSRRRSRILCSYRWTRI